MNLCVCVCPENCVFLRPPLPCVFLCPSFLVRFSISPRCLGHWDTGTLGHCDTGTLVHWDIGALGQWDNGLGAGAHLPQQCCDFFDPNPPLWGVLKKCKKNILLKEPKLINNDYHTHNNKTKSKVEPCI